MWEMWRLVRRSLWRASHCRNEEANKVYANDSRSPGPCVSLKTVLVSCSI